MEISKNNLAENYEDGVNTKSMYNFEFIRQRKFNNDNNNMNNQSKSYSILEKTNNIFGSNLGNKLYDSVLEQKENIDLYNSNRNIIGINDNDVKSKINQIKNKINNFDNNINDINNNKYGYESNFEMNRISNENIDLSNNNQKFVGNKGYYFNYRNDESFNKLNEQNIYPIDIKYNSRYKNESINYLNKDDNFDYKANFYMNDLTKKENSNEIREKLSYNRINENMYNYKEYLNENDKTKEIINKNVFNSMNINYNTNPKNTYNNYNSNDFRNNLRSESGFKLNHRKLNLNYDDNDINDVNTNVNMQINKLNVNNEPSYDIEKRYNIKTYFQLNQKDKTFNNNNNNDQFLDSFVESENKTKDYLNEITTKRLRKYHSFSTPKNLYINNNIEEKYNNITIGNNNKKDEMTQTNQAYDNKFYSFTQNRSYRNKDKENMDIISNNTFDEDNKVNMKIINNTTSVNNKTFIDNNKEEYNKKIFNTSFNNRLQQQKFNHKCIHKLNSYRNKNNKNIDRFYKTSTNIAFNNNRNICKKCLKSKMNFANLNNLRICKNCQNLINDGNLNNYFTFN